MTFKDLLKITGSKTHIELYISYDKEKPLNNKKCLSTGMAYQFLNSLDDRYKGLEVIYINVTDDKLNYFNQKLPVGKLEVCVYKEIVENEL